MATNKPYGDGHRIGAVKNGLNSRPQQGYGQSETQQQEESWM